jgi:hypothetical protein
MRAQISTQCHQSEERSRPGSPQTLLGLRVFPFACDAWPLSRYILYCTVSTINHNRFCQSLQAADCLIYRSNAEFWGECVVSWIRKNEELGYRHRRGRAGQSCLSAVAGRAQLCGQSVASPRRTQLIAPQTSPTTGHLLTCCLRPHRSRASPPHSR